MARFKRFVSAVFSSYVLLGANIVYSLATVPLALRYLSAEEFGLWSVTSQLSNALALLDLGMSSSLARLLVDYKDQKADNAYWSMIKTGWLISLVQAVLLLLIGLGAAYSLPGLLQIPPGLAGQFTVLMLWQAAIQATSLALRTFSQLLLAHQNQDIVYYGQVAGFAFSFLAVWVSLTNGYKAYSLIFGAAVGCAVTSITTIAGCIWLKLLPARHNSGKASYRLLSEVFGFSWDLFLVSLGNQLIASSQTIIVGRVLGLAPAAVWALCTQTFTVVAQLVWRAYDTANMGLSEMVAREERERLVFRFRSLTISTVALSVAAGVVFALCNQPFMRVWTRGNIQWPPVNDVLLAVLLVVRTIVRCHTGFAAINKRISTLKYVYFAEGITFVVVAFAVGERLGMTGIIAASIVCTALFTFSYTTWQTAEYFNLSTTQVAAQWQQRGLYVALVLLPVALPLFLFTRDWPAWWALVTNGSLAGIASLVVFWLYGIDHGLREELKARLIPGRSLASVA